MENQNDWESTLAFLENLQQEVENETISDGQLVIQTLNHFIDTIILKHGLPIKPYLNKIGSKSSFLVAATGLGKTVTVPLHILGIQLQLIDLRVSIQPKNTFERPTIWVVVPKIPIAQNEADHLNELWFAFCSKLELGLESEAMFGYRTSVGTSNPNAPIQFITTGVLSLIAQSGELKNTLDRVVIDEAHEVLETDEKVEIAIAQLWQQNVTVDYMSATVDTTGLEHKLKTKVILADAQRYTNWYVNTGKSLSDSISEIIMACFGDKDNVDSVLNFAQIPPSKAQYYYDGIYDGVYHCRPSGMLIIVNSFSSNNSDAKSIEKQISLTCKTLGVEVLMFASKIQRNKKLKREFDAAMKRIDETNSPYIIITTNVVEMGITWPTLDFVVTMDSEYQNVTENGFTFPQLVPLGTNALKQRGGRVGRKRPGIVFVTKDYGASFAEYSTDELNFHNKLAPEPIRFPLTHCEPKVLGYMFANLPKKVRNLHRYDRQLQDSVPSNEYVKQVFDFINPMNLPSFQTSSQKELGVYKIIQCVKYFNYFDITHTMTPTKAQAAKYAEPWISDPIYPFMLTGFEILTLVTPKTDRGYMTNIWDMAMGFMCLGVALQFPVSTMLRNDDVTGIKMNTLDLGQSKLKGYAVPLKEFNEFEYYPYSDLVNVARLIEDVTVFDNIKRNDPISHPSSRYNVELETQVQTFSALYNVFSLMVKTVKKALPASDEFVQYLDDEEFWYDDFTKENDEHGEDSWTISINIHDMFMQSEQIDYLQYKGKLIDYSTFFSQLLLGIYYKIGTRITSLKTSHPTQLSWQFTAMHEGKEVTGWINQGETYIPLDSTSEFWGILVPSFNKTTRTTVYRMVHLLKVPNDLEKVSMPIDISEFVVVNP